MRRAWRSSSTCLSAFRSPSVVCFRCWHFSAVGRLAGHTHLQTSRWTASIPSNSANRMSAFEILLPCLRTDKLMSISLNIGLEVGRTLPFVIRTARRGSRSRSHRGRVALTDDNNRGAAQLSDGLSLTQAVGNPPGYSPCCMSTVTLAQTASQYGWSCEVVRRRGGALSGSPLSYSVMSTGGWSRPGRCEHC